MDTAHDRAGGKLLQTLEELLDIRATTLEAVLDEASDRITSALGADKADVFLYEAPTGTLVAVGTSDTPMGRAQHRIGLNRQPVANGGRMVGVYETGKPYATGRAEEDPDILPGYTRGMGIRSSMMVPVEIGGERRGVIEVDSSEPDRFADDDLRILEAAAHWLGTVTHRTELLAHHAFHDPLTGLPNRSLLMDRLAHALERTARHGRSVAVLFVDLDRFKYVNDSLGHEAGDRLLAAAAGRLVSAVRPEDTVARLGGDEFVILLQDIEEAEDAIRAADRVLRAFGEPVEIGGRSVPTTASIGIAVGGSGWRRDHTGPEALLREADAAMYHAKRKGKARCEVYREGMGAEEARRLGLERELRRALERGEFVLHYQPKVELATGGIAALEALVRWEHPERGLVPPADFIPAAEESGLIVPMGRWVRREAYGQARAWRDRYPAAPALAVCTNLSTREFAQPDLAGEIAASLREAGLDAHLAHLEITESALLEDEEGAAATLRELARLGVLISLDDFGTGYSSLGRLKRLPIHSLKVDRSLIAGLGEDPRDEAIVKAAIALAAALGMRSVAEGVETEGQLARLRALGCDIGQGYLFAPPVPSGAVDGLLERAPAWGEGRQAAWVH